MYDFFFVFFFPKTPAGNWDHYLPYYVSWSWNWFEGFNEPNVKTPHEGRNLKVLWVGVKFLFVGRWFSFIQIINIYTFNHETFICLFISSISFSFFTISDHIFVLSDKNSDFYSCYSCGKRGRNTLIYTHKKNSSSTQQILCWKKISRPYQGIYELHKDVWNSRTFQGLQDWANPVAGHMTFQKKKKVFHFSPDT